ncbi:MAG TPA: ComEC/Rec2 family competence protein, partial [Candidatus Binatia bacterium]|nr:ComEC/Rec2 family competence protein [Candidatus Binatia bacterium]
MSLPKSQVFLLVCLCLIIVLSVLAHKIQPLDLREYYGQQHLYRVVIIQEPEVKEKSVHFIAELLEIDRGIIRTKIKVTTERYPVYEYGTELVLEGKLEPKSEFSAKENISGELPFPKVVSTRLGEGNRVMYALLDLKHLLLDAISAILPEPQSGLLGGILLGTKGMSKELQEDFRRTGTSHIVAVSGFNVTIVASMLDKIFRRLGRTASFYVSILAIAGFVVITGASASVVRAGFMGSLVLLAQHSGRIYSGVNSVAFAGAIMMVQNPRLLQFDIGFQLSFAALAGLMFIQPKLELLVSNSFLKNYIFPTLSAQITTTPLILYHFGNFS